MQQKTLQGLGFSKNESSVYLALLKLKAGTAIEITEQAGLAKSTVYDTLRDLSQKNLVNIYKKRGRKHFSVNDPSILKDIFAEQKTALDRMLPELFALYSKGSAETRVQLYKGSDGIVLVSEQIFDEAHELLGIGSPEELFKNLPESFPYFTERRKEKGIPLRAIFRDSPKARERQQQDRQDLRQSKLVKPSIPFSSLLYAWENKIALLTVTDEAAAVVIENKELAQMLRALFELLWNQDTESSKA